MMNLERAGTESHPLPQKHIGRKVVSIIGVEQAFRLYELSQWLPRFSSGFLTRGSLAGGVIVGAGFAIENYSDRTAIAQAAGCENTVLATTFLYAPDPDKSPNGVVVTTESSVIPIDMPEFGPTELLYRPNPNAPISKENPEKVISIDIDKVKDHGEGRTIVKEECNTIVGGKPGLFIEWRQRKDIKDYCNANGEQPRKPLTLANGEPGYTVSGQVVKSATIDSLVKSTSVTELKKVGTVVIERLAEALKVKPRFSAPENKPKEHFDFFKKRAAEIKVISEQIQKREIECSKPQTETKNETSTPLIDDNLKRIQADLQAANKSFDDSIKGIKADLQAANKSLDSIKAQNKALDEDKAKQAQEIASLKAKLQEAGSTNTAPIAAATGLGGIIATSLGAVGLKMKGII